MSARAVRPAVRGTAAVGRELTPTGARRPAMRRRRANSRFLRRSSSCVAKARPWDRRVAHWSPYHCDRRCCTCINTWRGTVAAAYRRIEDKIDLAPRGSCGAVGRCPAALRTTRAEFSHLLGRRALRYRTAAHDGCRPGGLSRQRATSEEEESWSRWRMSRPVPPQGCHRVRRAAGNGCSRPLNASPAGARVAVRADIRGRRRTGRHPTGGERPGARLERSVPRGTRGRDVTEE